MPQTRGCERGQLRAGVLPSAPALCFGDHPKESQSGIQEGCATYDSLANGFGVPFSLCHPFAWPHKLSRKAEASAAVTEVQVLPKAERWVFFLHEKPGQYHWQDSVFA